MRGHINAFPPACVEIDRVDRAASLSDVVGTEAVRVATRSHLGRCVDQRGELVPDLARRFGLRPLVRRKQCLGRELLQLVRIL
jgi:hypothetical protein